jgi:hypothetical protein
MAELYTFSEDGMRKLVEAYRAQQREMSNLRRHLAHYSTRRHEAVYLPGGTKTKIVTANQTLYAAFGGGFNTNMNVHYGNVESNALAISTGNYIPLSAGDTATQRNRVVYPRNCLVWERDSTGNLVRTTEVLSAFNPGSLPIPRFTFCYAEACHGSDNWVITGTVMPHASDSMFFSIIDGSTTIDGGTAKIIRASTFVHGPKTTSSPLTEWAHKVDADVYIHHPGTYEITYGVDVSRNSSDSADDTQWTDSDGDTLDLPNPLYVEAECLMNWNPTGAGTITTNWPGNVPIKLAIPARTGSAGVTGQRTFMVNHTLDTWHGQPYMRLSLAIRCTSGDGSADGKAKFNSGWIQIRPCGGGVEGGNQGSGYQLFHGGNFQWYGGGTEPAVADFGEDGT